MYVADQMTVSASLAGLPAISIPARTDGLPVGFQILGNRSQDLAVLSLAEELEKGGSDE
jgi:aspartyl-tRNA(Asn)/glutamyl-tRNA(Gln) amidotransferase subunit A